MATLQGGRLRCRGRSEWKLKGVWTQAPLIPGLKEGSSAQGQKSSFPHPTPTPASQVTLRDSLKMEQAQVAELQGEKSIRPAFHRRRSEGWASY